MYLSGLRTTFFGGRRIGYNEEKRKRTRAMKIRRGFGGGFRWFKRRGWMLFLAVLILGVAAWCNRFYLQRLNPMELRHLQYIDIEGNRMLSWEDVVQSAQVEPGMYMSEVNADSVEKALLQMPLVHSVKVRKHFPSSLEIKLKEASPVASLFEGGKATVYSERGMILPLSMTTAFHLPVIENESVDRVKQISAFLEVMRQSDKKLYEDVSQVGWSEADRAFEVFFRNVGHRVLFPEVGWNGDMFTLYGVVRSSFPRDLHCAGEVDMRYVGFAYVRNFDKRCVNG